MTTPVRAYLLRLLCLLLLSIGATGCLSSFIYFPDKELRATPARVGLPSQSVVLQTQDGVRLFAWYVPQQDARGLVLFFHGNGGNVSHYLSALALFSRLGYRSFIVDYRGYGKSEGTPSEQGTYQDAEAAWQYIVHTLKIPPESIVLYGRSLGGAIAAWLAAQHTPRLLVLESAFTSLGDAADALYPWLPTSLFIGGRYPTQAFLEQVRCPVLVIHSPDDEMIPYAQGRRLFERARPPKQFLQIRGGHNAAHYDSLTADLLDPTTW